MKKLRPYLLPLVAVPLIWLLLRDRPDVPFGRTVREPASGGLVAAEATVSAAPASGAVEKASPPAIPPMPRTTAELNSFADGPLPLPEKMRALTEWMRSGTPEQARAAALRAVFVVKNQDFPTLLQPLVVEGRVKPEAMEVLSLNLYDRPLNLLLPVWAQILEQPNHSLAAAAADGLEFHLKEKVSVRGPALAQAIKECLSGGRPN